MSLYNLIEVKKTAEKETQSIYPMDVLSDAINRMHNDFGGLLKLEDVIGAYCIVINNTTGTREDSAQWGEGVKERVYTHNDYADDNVAGYDSNKLAIANYHTKLAGQRSHEGCKFAITIHLGTTGVYMASDVWSAPIEEVEPQEEVEE